MTIKSMVTSGLSAAVPLSIAFLVTGLVFYFGGNQPVISQAQKGLNGAVSPTAPAAFF